MTEPPYRTRRIASPDPACGFCCGVHPLDDYFRRYALSNDQRNIGCTYVLDATDADTIAGLPPVLGYYTLSMAAAASSAVGSVLATRMPRYPMPVALIGRLAVDERARGRRLGEVLLLDALHRVVVASELIACLGVVVDAKDEAAEGFYAKYDFATLEAGSGWPRRMFLPVEVARAAFSDE